MNKKTIIPIVGIHSSGKTTIRLQLEKLGYKTEEECAEILRLEKGLKAGASATSSFEELVAQEEKKRDISRQWKDTNTIFVESWHILTLAYLLTRGVPEVELEEYYNYVRDKKKEYSIHCVFLKSDPSKILERSRKLHSEEDIGKYFEFYEKLGENIQIVLDKLNLDYRVFNSMKSIDTTLKEVVEYIETFVK